MGRRVRRHERRLVPRPRRLADRRRSRYARRRPSCGHSGQAVAAHGAGGVGHQLAPCQPAQAVRCLPPVVLQQVAHGADGILQFQWRAALGGAEKWRSGMLPRAGPAPGRRDEVVRLGRDLAALAPVGGRTFHGRRRRAARLGVLVGAEARLQAVPAAPSEGAPPHLGPDPCARGWPWTSRTPTTTSPVIAWCSHRSSTSSRIPARPPWSPPPRSGATVVLGPFSRAPWTPTTGSALAATPASFPPTFSGSGSRWPFSFREPSSSWSARGCPGGDHLAVDRGGPRRRHRGPGHLCLGWPRRRQASRHPAAPACRGRGVVRLLRPGPGDPRDGAHPSRSRGRGAAGGRRSAGRRDVTRRSTADIDVVFLLNHGATVARVVLSEGGTDLLSGAAVPAELEVPAGDVRHRGPATPHARRRSLVSTTRTAPPRSSAPGAASPTGAGSPTSTSSRLRTGARETHATSPRSPQ